MAYLVRILALLALLAIPAAATAQVQQTVSDIHGRQVSIPREPKRILLGEGHLLVAMSLIHPDPANLVVAWQGDLKRHSPEIMERMQARNPKIANIAIVGEASPDTFSVEQALSSLPDLAIFSGCYGPSIQSVEVIKRLEDAGVPVIFVDFFTDPLKNTRESMAILGQVLGRKTQADAFNAFYGARLDRISSRLTEANPEKPSVMLQAFAGAWDCCWLPGNVNFGSFITFAGGRNIGSGHLAQRPWGQMSLEYILTEDPQIYISTGNPHMSAAGGLVLGVGVAADAAQASFETVLSKPGVADLSAVKAGRTYGLWHLFHDLPLNIVAIESLAKWIHPDLFADVDPKATMDEINRSFLAVPLEGTFDVSTQ
jgi:iron complex transport system substrate-binding protein